MEAHVICTQHGTQSDSDEDEISQISSIHGSSSAHNESISQQTDSYINGHHRLQDNGGGNKATFLEQVRASSLAVQAGDFNLAVQLYTSALNLDPGNHILYSNRAAAYIHLRQYKVAVRDAKTARTLNPKWIKAYYREGTALQCLNRDGEAMAAYAAGLVQEPKSGQLLQALVNTAMQSQIAERFGPIYQQLQKMKLEQSPFVVLSVIGQELVSVSSYGPSRSLLETALQIGTCSLKLRGSVFSALSTAHWGMGQVDKAIACMQQDLDVVRSLADHDGECRVHGNLGAAYFSQGRHRESLQHHRQQLALALRLHNRESAASALSSLGHVHTAAGDFANALASHRQCVALARQASDRRQEARQVGSVGAVYLAMGDWDRALECHKHHLQLAKQLGDKQEQARALSNMGSAHHYKRDFPKATEFHSQVLSLAQNLGDRTLEARAYAGLGHASRAGADYKQSLLYHQKQLDIALQTRDRVSEGRACSNLGIIYQQLGEYSAALKLHKAHLQIAKDLCDRASQGRAYANIGNAHSTLKEYDLAIGYHKQQLSIAREVLDKHAESATHGNLAVAYQAMHGMDKALNHYSKHLEMSRELKDTSSETRALSNLGNFYSAQKNYSEAVLLYEQWLILSQELHDVEGEGKACHKLGYAHYCLGNFPEAIRYYEQDLALAKDQQDKSSMCRAYCNLGLAHKALNDYPKSLECQKYFLATAHMIKNVSSKFCALGNIGDVLLKLGQHNEAVQMFTQQLQLAKQCKDRKLEATALGHLGSVHRAMSQFDKALGFHNQELTVYQELSHLPGECKAHSNLGNVHMALGNYTNAYRCYEEQLDRSRELKESNIEAHAHANLGITKMNMAQFEEAIGHFEQQLAMLEQVSGYQAAMDRGRANGNLGDCYEALGDCDEAIKCYEMYLSSAQSTSHLADQDKAYRGLGSAHRAIGNLQQALVCFEKRLVVSHELERPEAISSAYGELGCLHSLLGNFEQAVSCLQHQLRLAREQNDQAGQGEAACGLGGVHQQMGEYDKALEYHQLDLKLATETRNPHAQCRGHGNLGLSYESLGNFEEAITAQEQHLEIAAQVNDAAAKTLAFSSLGRVHHALGNYPEAINYLRQGLVLADSTGQREDEAKIRHRLGLALMAHAQLPEAQAQLYKATQQFESIRREAQLNSDYKLSLFDLQTASYQALQRVLVSQGHSSEALGVAERGRTRAFVDLLLERQGLGQTDNSDMTPPSTDQLLAAVNAQKAAVLYFSLAAGYLYSWLILPGQGIVKFHESSVQELEANSDPEDVVSLRSMRSLNASAVSLLDMYVGQARESLGVEAQLSSSRSWVSRTSVAMSETESDAEDLWQQHLEEIGERLNASSDKTGFLRMLSRAHVWNASSLSLGSMVSMGSGPSSLLRHRQGSTRSKSSSSVTSSSGKPALSSLYELLIAPIESYLPAPGSGCNDLVLVLQGDLYLVPFSVLKCKQGTPFLFERYNIQLTPSIHALQASQAAQNSGQYNPDCCGAMVVGNPRLPQTVSDQWQWGPLPAAEHECRMVAEMMGCRSLVGPTATKDGVMQQMKQAEVIHFATHISWKLSALVLSPGDFSTTRSVHGNMERMELTDSSSEMDNSFDGPPLSEFLLTAADILNIKLSAKLVVLSAGHTDERAGRVNTDGVVGLTRALLAAGARCVLFCLWQIPEMASRMLLKSFYTALLQGAASSHALSTAMRTVQNTRQFCHPSNWAGWALIGSDIRLSSKVALMGHALCQLLRTPDKSREAMRVVLHLVEKTLLRIRQGQRNAMYTTQQSIENKVGDIFGWKDLLISVGFRFEPGSNGLPASVFFPTSDPGDRLTQCSASLQALLGLAVPTLTALAKMTEQHEVGETLLGMMQEVSGRFGQEGSVQLPISVRLWRAPGVHEFLASVGFDLVDVGKEEVTIKAGKQAGRRVLQFALQVLVAIFDTQEAPRSLLDSSSSLESLASSSSATSTSNFSKGSSPPTSPTSRKRSYFNPAEVEKMPTVASRKQDSRSLNQNPGPANISLQLLHQDEIRRKYSSPSASDMSDSNTPDDAPRIISVEIGNQDDALSTHSGHSQRSRQSLPERLTAFRSRGAHYQYSTSASDSEDAIIPENFLSRSSLTQSRASLASQSSTLTARSTGSHGSGFRRSRFRNSAASTRSSASDRTITNDSRAGSSETIVGSEVQGTRNSQESLASQGSGGSRGRREHSSERKHRKPRADKPRADKPRAEKPRTDKRTKKEPPEPTSYDLDDGMDKVSRKPDKQSTKSETRIKDPSQSVVKKSENDSATMDPSSVALKVLAETKDERRKLEEMQQWSVKKLQHQLNATKLNPGVSQPPPGAHSGRPTSQVLRTDTESSAFRKPVDNNKSVQNSQTPPSTTQLQPPSTNNVKKPPPPLIKPKPTFIRPRVDNETESDTSTCRSEPERPDSTASTGSLEIPAEVLVPEPPSWYADLDSRDPSLSDIHEESEVSIAPSPSISLSSEQSIQGRRGPPVVRNGMPYNLTAMNRGAKSGPSKSVTFQEIVEMRELCNTSMDSTSSDSLNRPTHQQRPSNYNRRPLEKVSESDQSLKMEFVPGHPPQYTSSPVCELQSDSDLSDSHHVMSSMTTERTGMVVGRRYAPAGGFRTPPSGGFRAPPPPYPGHRSGSSMDSTTSSERSAPESMQQRAAGHAGVVPSMAYSTESEGSASDTLDFSSPQNLQRASRSFYPARELPNPSQIHSDNSSVPVTSRSNSMGSYNNQKPTFTRHHPGNQAWTAGGVVPDHGGRDMVSPAERAWYQSDSEDTGHHATELNASWTSADSETMSLQQHLVTHGRSRQGPPPVMPSNHTRQSVDAAYRMKDRSHVDNTVNTAVYPGDRVASTDHQPPYSTQPQRSHPLRTFPSSQPPQHNNEQPDSKVLYKGVVVHTSSC